jgi:hypothetical protein
MPWTRKASLTLPSPHADKRHIEKLYLGVAARSSMAPLSETPLDLPPPPSNTPCPRCEGGWAERQSCITWRAPILLQIRQRPCLALCRFWSGRRAAVIRAAPLAGNCSPLAGAALPRHRAAHKPPNFMTTLHIILKAY